MKKYFLSLAAMVLGLLGMTAQQMPQLTPLALQPGVKSGVLPNGLSYYILHNEEPKERANFYIAQKVGSTLENQDQLGLAHFLEHMAFNGTTHYPGKSMLNYLQANGIRFGEDINAYTGFDETVYRINNVPTTNKALMDSVLLVLRDWSDGIALEEEEIDAERGVIHEEWRQRNDANTRMMTAMLPQVYKEYQYQQMPIGKMDVVLNFKPEVLRAYYKKWYRPDQQGIIVVGDFDADEMEQKVKALFSDIVMPEDAAVRVYPTVSDNEQPIYAVFTDKELQFPSLRLYFKYDKTPFEMRNTVEAYMQDEILSSLMSMMLNERLSEYQQQPDCPYVYAMWMDDDFLISKTKGAVMVFVVPKDDLVTATNGAMKIIAEALKGGFNQGEFDRAVEKLNSSMEKRFNERNTTDSDVVANRLIRHFIDNTPNPGIEAEMQLVKGMIPMIPLEAINMGAAQSLQPTNEVFMVSLPEGKPVPEEAAMVAAVNDALNAQYEAKIEEVITDPLIAKLPKPGKIKSESQNTKYGATEMVLSNGVKVIVKTTDFKGDEIMMQAYREGGKRGYSVADGVNVQLVSDAVDSSNLGSFDPVKLRRYLSGKHVSLGFDINNYTDIMQGYSNVKDLPTLMELVYATFTSLNPNKETFDVQMQQAITLLENMDKDPRKVFKDNVNKANNGENALVNELTADMIKSVDYNRSLEIAKKAMSNAADYTFIFVGNVDAATLKPLLEQYIATLPSAKKPSKVQTVTDLTGTKGEVKKQFTATSQTPMVMVYDQLSGYDLDYNAANSIMMGLTGDLLDMVYLETLREDEGGTYGAGVAGYMNPNTNKWMLLYQYSTNPDKREAMLKRALDEQNNLLDNGAKAEHFSKVKEAAITKYNLNQRDNGYWLNRIFSSERGFDIYGDYENALKGVTIEQQNEFMKKLNDGKNHIEVIMDTVEEGK